MQIFFNILIYKPTFFFLKATTYFKKEHFKTSIPMAITSMLVMYTLNQSVSSKLPATAYMKLIDVWLLFGLLLPFVIILLLILMEHLPAPHNPVAPLKITSAAMVKKVLADGIPEQKTGNGFFLSKNNVTKFARYTLPIFEIVFVSFYATIAFVVYYT